MGRQSLSTFSLPSRSRVSDARGKTTMQHSQNDNAELSFGFFCLLFLYNLLIIFWVIFREISRFREFDGIFDGIFLVACASLPTLISLSLQFTISIFLSFPFLLSPWPPWTGSTPRHSFPTSPSPKPQSGGTTIQLQGKGIYMDSGRREELS